MAILKILLLAELLLFFQDTHANVIRLNANTAGDITQKSLPLMEARQSSRIILHFDDVPTDESSGTGTISTYSYMNFSGFTTVNTIKAASLGTISIHDVDCASSQPNALFSDGARAGHKVRSQWAADTAKLHSAGLSGYFDLNGLYLKPLGEVPSGLILEINAWEIRDSEAQNVYTAWIAYTKGGYQDMQYCNLTIPGRSWGGKVNMVEIFTRAPAGKQDVSDWAFCLDDLDVDFLDRRADE